MTRFVVFLFLMLFSAKFAVAERPNILFLIADDASKNSFGCYGSTYVNTPNFDRLAREGVLFSNAYNCNPKCAPARACLLTGRFSWQLKEACNHNPFLSDEWVFYPQLLEQSGYCVGFTGKGWGPGIWKTIDGGKSGFGKENPAGHPFQNKKLKSPYRGISNMDYAGNFADFLQQKPADQPFCFWLGTREPHRKYEKDSWKKAGKKLEDVTVQKFFPDTPTVRGDLADYSLEVEWYDHHIGKCLQLLESKKMLDNTLIIATSDHGMPFPRIKGQMYEEAFHVPMVARWGNKINAGRVVTDFVSFPDLAPTLLEVANVAPHQQMTGKSFLSQLVSEKSGRIDELRDFVVLGKERHDIGRTDGEQLSVGYPVRAIRTDKFLYVKNFKPDRWPVGNPEYGFMNTDGSPTKTYLMDLKPGDGEFAFQALAFGKRPAEELFDMVSDLDCVTNLAEKKELNAVKLQLSNRMTQVLTEQRDPRVLGNGDIFDAYPNCRIERQQQVYGRPDWNPVDEFEGKYGKNSGKGSDKK